MDTYRKWDNLSSNDKNIFINDEVGFGNLPKQKGNGTINYDLRKRDIGRAIYLEKVEAAFEMAELDYFKTLYSNGQNAQFFTKSYYI